MTSSHPPLRTTPRNNVTPPAITLVESEKLSVNNLNLTLSSAHVLRNISFSLNKTGITCLVGPSGAGKSSLLKCLNRQHDQWTGIITLDGISTHDPKCHADDLRKTIGLIQQTPTVFPCSIHDNVIFGIRGKQRRNLPSNLVKKALTDAALWHEVKNRLSQPAQTLSVGQQQRLCLARTLALNPSVLLLDEPTAALDAQSKLHVEQLITRLSQTLPILSVTHDLDQAKRLGGQVIFMCEGKIIEKNSSEGFFSNPVKVESHEFIRWSMCDC